MAYTYGQGLSNTGAAYNLWGTPASAPNPYYTQGPTYTKGLYDYSPQQAEAQSGGGIRFGGFNLVGKKDPGFISADEQRAQTFDAVYNRTDPDYQRAQTFDAQGPNTYPNTPPPSILNPPYVTNSSTTEQINALSEYAPYVTMPQLNAFNLPETPQITVTGGGPMTGSPFDPNSKLSLNASLFPNASESHRDRIARNNPTIAPYIDDAMFGLLGSEILGL